MKAVVFLFAILSLTACISCDVCYNNLHFSSASFKTELIVPKYDIPAGSVIQVSDLQKAAIPCIEVADRYPDYPVPLLS